MTRHVLLVARSVTHHGGHDAVHRLAATVGAARGVPVRACFLDGAEPSLHAALDTAVAEAAGDVLLVPAHLPPDRYLDTWIRRAIAHWRQTRGDDLPIAVTAPLAGQPALADAVAQAIAGAHAPLTGNPGPFRSPSWSQITRHRRHVLVCRGPRCTAYGAGDVAAALGDRLAEHRLGDDDVLVTATGCLFPCNLGPLVVVHPDDTWYTGVDPHTAVRIADEHLRDGRPVDDRPSRPAG
ncbi:CbiX/SirB N-terminal domain-containing protein [Actinoplanes sp. NEAU-A12]|uniref:CbiX/SirB N-terminal domain-containing protein n=1 Tax=Actinoplanes sandaracinus TaxID=3045177 RepID=A0ABT6WYK2_9ACTN|nr:(2Fe-2S) ferredoxin domain-containing protein [Actinoplanes sandaracinus]MDI6104764.1 CbiX/SirB N-terminal domain-containing protein [Actinoplanes sandaracinus]